MTRLYINLLLLGKLAEVTENMTYDSLYVLSTLASANAVGETDVLLIGALLILIDTARQDCRDFPAVRAALIGDSRAILGEQVNILLEGVRWNDLTVP